MISKTNWTEQEDQFLRISQSKQEKRNWVQISKMLNQKFPHKLRSSKQRRQRFINHSSILKQNQKAFNWKEQEIENLLKFFIQIGPQWTQISKQFLNKTENSTKNKFYSIIRKTTRHINDMGKKVLDKKYKNIKYEALLRIIRAKQSIKTLSNHLYEKSLQVTQKIITIAKNINGETADQDIMNLIREINKFNLDTRNYKQEKYKVTSSFSNSKNRDNFQKQHDNKVQTHFQICTKSKMSDSFIQVQDLVNDQRINDFQLFKLHSPEPTQHQDTTKWNVVLFDDDMINDRINQSKDKMRLNEIDHLDMLYLEQDS